MNENDLVNPDVEEISVSDEDQNDAGAVDHPDDVSNEIAPDSEVDALTEGVSTDVPTNEGTDNGSD